MNGGKLKERFFIRAESRVEIVASVLNTVAEDVDSTSLNALDVLTNIGIIKRWGPATTAAPMPMQMLIWHWTDTSNTSAINFLLGKTCLLQY